MGSKFSSGFTIIELMLFLAITGLLISGILVNAASSLNDQRYREGVEATRNIISAQYAKVYSLTNEASSRDAHSPCSTDAPVGSSIELRGVSNCLYVGRLLRITTVAGVSRTTLTPLIAQPVAASGRVFENQQSTGGQANRSDSWSQYVVKQYDGSANLTEEKEFDWQLAAVRPGNARPATPMDVSLAIVRSPVDGTVMTYDLLAQSPGTIDYNNLSGRFTLASQADVKFCIADLEGTLDPPQRMAILLRKAATGPGDVETRLNNPAEEGGGAAC